MHGHNTAILRGPYQELPGMPPEKEIPKWRGNMTYVSFYLSPKPQIQRFLIISGMFLRVLLGLVRVAHGAVISNVLALTSPDALHPNLA